LAEDHCDVAMGPTLASAAAVCPRFMTAARLATRKAARVSARRAVRHAVLPIEPFEGRERFLELGESYPEASRHTATTGPGGWGQEGSNDEIE
jgi:hypothetical protein